MCAYARTISDADLTNLPQLLFRLTGALPDSFEKLSSLVELRLGSNMFSGELRSFGDLEFLLQLDLSGKGYCVMTMVFRPDCNTLLNVPTVVLYSSQR